MVCTQTETFIYCTAGNLFWKNTTVFKYISEKFIIVLVLTPFSQALPLNSKIALDTKFYHLNVSCQTVVATMHTNVYA